MTYLDREAAQMAIRVHAGLLKNDKDNNLPAILNQFSRVTVSGYAALLQPGLTYDPLAREGVLRGDFFEDSGEVHFYGRFFFFFLLFWKLLGCWTWAWEKNVGCSGYLKFNAGILYLRAFGVAKLETRDEFEKILRVIGKIRSDY